MREGGEEKPAFLCPSVHELGLKCTALSYYRFIGFGFTNHSEKIQLKKVDEEMLFSE